MTLKPAKALIGLTLFAASSTLSSSLFAIDLQQVYQQALNNEHQYKADTAAYEAGLESYKVGRAGLLPSIGTSAVYSDSEARTADALRGNFASDVGITYTVSLSQPLFDLSAWFNYKEGVVLTEQARAQYSSDQQAFIVRVASAYFDVLRAADVLDNGIAREKALKHQLEQTQQRFEVGLTAITDVHDAQATYDSARADTLADRVNLGSAYDTLEVITGSSYDQVASLADNFPVTEPVPNNRDQWVEFALTNNFALKASKLSAKAAKHSARSVRNSYNPTVEASISESDNRRFQGANDIEQTSISVRVDFPLYAGGGVKAQARQAESRYQQAQENYLQTKREIVQAARSQHLTVLTDVATVDARKQAIVSSESSLEATEAGYEVGTRDFVDVLNAQQGVFQARSDYYNALYAYILDTLRLKQTAGLLGPKDLLDLNQWLDENKTKSRADYDKL